MIIGHVIMLKSSETCPLLIYIYKSDPSYYFGINIGGIRKNERWKVNLENNFPITEQCIKISEE